MVSTQLTVSACPTKDSVYENCLFVNPHDALYLEFDNKKINYLLIGDKPPLIYRYKRSSKMDPGNIGLSKIIRQATHYNTGDNLNVRNYIIPKDENLNLVYLKFTLKCLAGVIEMAEDSLIDLLTVKLQNEILNIGASYLFDIEGSGAITATVDCLKVASIPLNGYTEDLEDVSVAVRTGIITKMTSFDFENESKNLKIKSAKKQVSLFGPKWKYSDMGIGGLDLEFTRIFRRAFASRTLPPRIIKSLGIEHVKGLLLFGPPGTGKTLIARQIGKMLQGREPKIVNGPEILNKYVGQSEENIRALFADAEEDFASNGESSDLHIIIFDEIDAICKQRGTASGGTGVHDTVVNQLLSKMDGVDSLNNVLVIGMTNRKDMIDSALLRPGRFEVHVEIGLPDEKGREEILKIHTKAMRDHGFLGKDVDLKELAARTKNFSGAEIAGLVKSATSFAYYSGLDIRDQGVSTERVENVRIDKAAFMQALNEVSSAFGVSEDRISRLEGKGLIDYSAGFVSLKNSCNQMVEKLRNNEKLSLLTVLLEGPTGCGKTALAAHIAKCSEFPFTKIISPEDYVGWNEVAKCAGINNEFEDAYKSPLSFLLLDDLERLLGYVDIGPRFSNLTLQTILVLLKRNPPFDIKTKMDRKLCVIATTSDLRIIEEMGLSKVFMIVKTMPLVDAGNAARILEDYCEPETCGKIKEFFEKNGNGIGIKTLLNIREMATPL